MVYICIRIRYFKHGLCFTSRFWGPKKGGVGPWKGSAGPNAPPKRPPKPPGTKGPAKPLPPGGTSTPLCERGPSSVYSSSRSSIVILSRTSSRNGWSFPGGGKIPRPRLPSLSMKSRDPGSTFESSPPTEGPGSAGWLGNSFGKPEIDKWAGWTLPFIKFSHLHFRLLAGVR